MSNPRQATPEEGVLEFDKFNIVQVARRRHLKPQIAQQVNSLTNELVLALQEVLNRIVQSGSARPVYCRGHEVTKEARQMLLLSPSFEVMNY